MQPRFLSVLAQNVLLIFSGLAKDTLARPEAAASPVAAGSNHPMKMFPRNCIQTFLTAIFLPVGLYAVPANDPFSAPTVIGSFPASVSGSNVAATIETDESKPDIYVGASVWFEWTAAADGRVQIDTSGSDFDTVLAVWTGSSVTSLTHIASNDDYLSSQSAIFIDAEVGVTYRIAVYGYENQTTQVVATGNITLNLSDDTTARIYGTVTAAAGGAPLADISATAYRWNPLTLTWEWYYRTQSVADGDFIVGGLIAGTYRVSFSDPVNGEYATEYYNDQATIEAASDIVLDEAEIATGIDASMAVMSASDEPQIIGFERTGETTVEILFTGAVGIEYQLQKSATLSSWEDVNNPFICQPGTNVLTSSASGSMMFWKVTEAP
jgi:hypothetical protein